MYRLRYPSARCSSRAVHDHSTVVSSKRFLVSRCISLDDHLHSSLSNWRSHNPECSYARYRHLANRVLSHVLPYEPYPSACRRADHIAPNHADRGIGDGLILVVHAVQTESGEVEYTTCSGFLVTGRQDLGEEVLGVTCSHTLEEIEYRHPNLPKRSFALFPSSPTSTTLIPLSIISSLPRLDILILRPHFPSSLDPKGIRTLPVSPYPVYRDQPVSVHFFGSPGRPVIRRSKIVDGRYEHVEGNRSVRSQGGREAAEGKSIPWLAGMGWRRWVQGRMLGYRGDLWEEVETGTTDSLPYILTSPLPPPGSSGGPIIDSQSGAVMGVISGTRTDNRVEGERGWGSSAENIYELFSLPGFIPLSQWNGGK